MLCISLCIISEQDDAIKYFVSTFAGKYHSIPRFLLPNDGYFGCHCTWMHAHPNASEHLSTM